jgi:hypothetical protein
MTIFLCPTLVHHLSCWPALVLLNPGVTATAGTTNVLMFQVKYKVPL